jgi:hypothetical protein
MIAAKTSTRRNSRIDIHDPHFPLLAQEIAKQLACHSVVIRYFFSILNQANAWHASCRTNRNAI